jgi:membrane-associated protein
MHTISIFIDFILHLNQHLAEIVSSVGNWSYVILILIIFAETGLVVTPFLPGDSLLFAAGALASISSLNVYVLILTLILAGIAGNSTNYAIGYWLGPKVFHFPKSRWFNPIYLTKAHSFYEKYGGRAIILARFIPIIRTFAPFVAGIARMHWARYQLFNIIGSVTWVGLFITLGYFFGNVPFIQKNFSLVMIAIIFISILPPFIEYIKQKRKAN